MTIKELINRLVLQLNLVNSSYFLREVVESTQQVFDLANQGATVVAELESLMASWQNDTFLLADKEAELLFTDEQLAALATLKKNIQTQERRLTDLRRTLIDLDRARQKLEKTLLDQDEDNLASHQLVLISQEYWLQLALWRKNNIIERKTALITLVEDLKASNQQRLSQLAPAESSLTQGAPVVSTT